MNCILRAGAGLLALAAVNYAAPMALAKTAPAPETVRIWPGAAPGTEDWTGPEVNTPLKMPPHMQLPGHAELAMVGNVTVPTLTIYRPATGKANGTAVMVAPGGGFQTLAMTHEGEMVAEWLVQRGVTAFVLKYRVKSNPNFRIPPDLRRHPERFAQFAATFDAGRPIAVADGIQAMRYIRANAGRYGIATDRVGMIGFSAGAITTMGVVMNAAPSERPNFAAPIYGAMEDKAPPADGPPLFIAVTQDDGAVPADQSVAIFSQWTKAGLPAEMHVYEAGGHGFGMTTLGKPVDGWTNAFEAWLRSHGWLAAPAKK